MIIQLVVYLILLFPRTLQDDSNRLGKQQELDAHPKAMQQINFAGNLDWDGNATMFPLLKKER